MFQKRFTLSNLEVRLAENEDIAVILLPPQPDEASQNHFIRVAETDVSAPVGTQVGYLGLPAICATPHGENFMAMPYCNFGEVCPQAGNCDNTMLIHYEPGPDLDPQGLSGSGIWYSPSSGKIWAPQLALVGLVTEYDLETERLVGYRVETLIQFLKTKDPWPSSAHVEASPPAAHVP